MKWYDVADRLWTFTLDFGVYMFCVAGVFFSRYLPAFYAGDDIDLKMPAIGNIILSLLIAWTITFSQEHRKPSSDISPEKAREIKREHFVSRANFALAQGFMWQSVMGFADPNS